MSLWLRHLIPTCLKSPVFESGPAISCFLMLLKWLRARGGPASSFATSVIEFESKSFSLVQFASSKTCVWSSFHLSNKWCWTGHVPCYPCLVPNANCKFVQGSMPEIPKHCSLACHRQVKRISLESNACSVVHVSSVVPLLFCLCHAKRDRKWMKLPERMASPHQIAAFGVFLGREVSESFKLMKFSRISVCDTSSSKPPSKWRMLRTRCLQLWRFPVYIRNLHTPWPVRFVGFISCASSCGVFRGGQWKWPTKMPTKRMACSHHQSGAGADILSAKKCSHRIWKGHVKGFPKPRFSWNWVRRPRCLPEIYRCFEITFLSLISTLYSQGSKNSKASFAWLMLSRH